MIIEPPPNSVQCETRSEWRDWLSDNYARREGVWLITYKKAAGKPLLSYDAAVEEALCWGWIDSKGRKLDDERTMLWYAPRNKGTGWSKPNKERIERAIAAGQMAPSGLAKIEAAKQDGSWNALDAVERLEIPPDLPTALAEIADAAGNFDAFPRSAKRGILEWISSAKTAETRAKRIAETARLAGENIRANQWQRRPADKA